MMNPHYYPPCFRCGHSAKCHATRNFDLTGGPKFIWDCCFGTTGGTAVKPCRCPKYVEPKRPRSKTTIGALA